MGLETAAIVLGGLQMASAIGNFNAEKSGARNLARQGEIAAQNRAKEIKNLASKQRVSYLNAGLELEGTPQAVINDTYQTGIDDVNAIISSTNQQIKNKMTKARANLLGGIAGTGMSMFKSGLFKGNGVSESSGGSITNTFNGVYQGGSSW